MGTNSPGELTLLYTSENEILPMTMINRPDKVDHKCGNVKTNPHSRKSLKYSLTLLLLTLAVVLGQKGPSETDKLVLRTTQASSVKQVFLLKDYSIVSLPLHLKEIETTIDNLHYRLSSIRYSSDLEHVQPEVKIANSYLANNRVTVEKVTTFRRALTLFDGATLCNKLNLPVLDLDNLPKNLDAHVLLHLEIRTEEDSILCITIKLIKRDLECLKYILSRTNMKQFHRTNDALEADIRKYKTKSVFIEATKKGFYLTRHNYGTVGCKGEFLETAIKEHGGMHSKLHNQYYVSMSDLVVNLLTHLEKYVNYLTESLHKFSSETFIPPGSVSTKDDLIKGILDNMPTVLRNADFSLNRFIDFEKFFRKKVAGSSDDLLKMFINRTELELFRPRQLKTIYSAAVQFKENTKYRISRFLLHFSSTNYAQSIPNTWLFSRDQNPITFAMVINSLLPEIDSSILQEIFVIVQNRKMNLINDLKSMIRKDVQTKYISHREMENDLRQSKRRIVKLDRTRTKDILSVVPDPAQSDAVPFPRDLYAPDANQAEPNSPETVTDSQNSSNTLNEGSYWATDSTVSSGESSTPLSISSSDTDTLNGTVSTVKPSDTYWIREDGSIDYELLPGPDPDRHDPNLPPRNRRMMNMYRRAKRSGFLTNTFGIVTQDDLVDLYRQEMLLDNREDTMERQISNVTSQTNTLLVNYKAMASDLTNIALTEKNMMNYIDDLMKSEIDSTKKLESIARTLDRLSVMSSEYSSINLQITLLIHSIEKMHTLVQSGLSGTLDVAQFPVDLLHMYSPNSLRIAAQFTSVEFTYERDGYYIRLRLPQLSEPFKMYSIRSIPVYQRDTWVTINLDDSIVINNVADVLVGNKIEKICEQRENYFICSPSDLTIRHSAVTCSSQLVNALTDSTPDLSECKFDRIQLRADDQYGLVTQGAISISSMFTDKLEYICLTEAESKSVDVPIGFSIHKLSPNCVYETSKLTIYNPPEFKKAQLIQDNDLEIDLIAALSELETLLDDVLEDDAANVTGMQSTLARYEQEQSASIVTYEQLRKDLKQTQEIKQLGTYNPTKIDIKMPLHQKHWLAGTFWVVTVLVLITCCGCCCRCFPGCLPAIYKSTAWCCTGWIYSIRECWEMRQSNSLQDNDLEMANVQPEAGGDSNATAPLIDSKGDPNVAPDVPVRYPDLENFYETTKPKHQWKLAQGSAGEWLCCTSVPDGLGHNILVYYDINKGESFDQYDHKLSYVTPPPSNLIIKLQDKVRKSPKPHTEIVNNVIQLRGSPHIIYNKEAGIWLNRNTKRVISGLNAPEM